MIPRFAASHADVLHDPLVLDLAKSIQSDIQNHSAFKSSALGFTWIFRSPPIRPFHPRECSAVIVLPFCARSNGKQ